VGTTVVGVIVVGSNVLGTIVVGAVVHGAALVEVVQQAVTAATHISQKLHEKGQQSTNGNSGTSAEQHSKQ